MVLMSRKEHWEDIFKKKLQTEVSWYQSELRQSIELVDRAQVSSEAPVIDIGGGDSTLVDDLLKRGYERITVLDISSGALKRAKQRLGERGETVRWIESDVTRVELPETYYDLWHDRAVFHFLTDPDDRRAYTKVLSHALKPQGHVIIATFASDGPEKCSGLPTMRYNPHELNRELGEEYVLVDTKRENHMTPGGAEQRFVYCLFRRRKEVKS
jgi:ubiquinone/menaquinone biosynthesis C-methylase UbiE